jgi:hypothetical protein
MAEHALLSPSAAERWIACPASIRMEGEVPPEAESSYAHEGTAAHALAEIKASLAFGKITKRQAVARRAKWDKEFEEYAENPEVMVEMEEHTDAYVALLEERMALYPNSILFLEQRLPTGLPDGGKGTSDAVIVSPVHIEVIDFKYGAGVAVEARGNPQLRIYAFGALGEYGDLLGETELIRITVHQPRMDHVLTDEITPLALREWHAGTAVPQGELALSDDAPFGPSDEACRWCPASGRCRAQLEAVFATDFEEKPDVLSPEEMAETLGKRKLVADWLNAFEVAALDMAYSKGTPIPGYKVVLSGGQRRVQDQEAAHLALREAGLDDDEILSPSKVKGIGDLEKLLGKERFKELLEEPGIVKKTEGKPALAPESDSRPAIAPNSEARKVFTSADEEDLI